MILESRLSREDFFMGVLKLLTQRSTCERLHVSCLIIKDNRIISMGYNGPLKDELHCDEFNCDLTKSCERAVHAEVNAIAFAVKEGISIKGSKIYCTHSPCMNCAELIIQSGIEQVFYIDLFRDNEPLLRLNKNSIRCTQLGLK